MGKAPLLQQLYRHSSSRLDPCTAFESFAITYFDDLSFEEDTLKEVCGEMLLNQKKIAIQNSPLAALEPWRQLLSLLLVLQEKKMVESVRSDLRALVQLLKQTAFWPTFQLATIYQKLVELLLEQNSQDSEDDISLIAITQMPSGAARLECGGYWPWAQVPHPRFHAELGTLWAIYATLSGNSYYREAAKKLAEWQCHTLDHQFLPFVGLFSQEEDASESLLLTNNALLFTAVSEGESQGKFLELADKQLDSLQKVAEKEAVHVSVHAAIFEKWLTKYTDLQDSISKEINLSSLHDQSLALVGCRLDNSSAVSTLVGGSTGMGCFHVGDVRVVSYGPQLANILGDCRGFGIQSSVKQLDSHPHKIEAHPSSYTIEGVAHIAPRPREQELPAVFRLGKQSGFWIDSKHTFELDKLTIDARFYGVYDISELAFAFFVKAQSCVVGAGRVVKPRSFDRYRGNTCPIVMQSGDTLLNIIPQNCDSEMQVIPLGGEGAFWGADFLVAYLLDNKLGRHKWELTPSS